jgi:hypothetical protein
VGVVWDICYIEKQVDCNEKWIMESGQGLLGARRGVPDIHATSGWYRYPNVRDLRRWEGVSASVREVVVCV